MLYWILIQCDKSKLTWSYILRSLTYITCSSDFSLHLEGYLMDKCHNWDITSISDLQFMLQWFCTISWRLFDGGMLYWRHWFSATLTLTYKYMWMSVTYISWCNDSVLYLEHYLMNKPHSLDIDSVWYWPLTCISWFGDFELFTYFAYSSLWSLIWKCFLM